MTGSGRGWSPPARLLVALAVLAPAVPLLVALLARRSPPWVPDLDLALTELRVRDVGGPHSPLVGLPGRIGTLQEQGSHPGPISFYLLAPVYRLLGSTVFALQASTVVLHLGAVGVAVGLVVRRAGARWALAVGVGLAALVAGLGPNLFTEPWNPHLPLLWWPAFLVAAWAALCGDRVALPWLVLAGAVCAQTHVSYLGAVGVLTVAAALVCLRWPDRAAGGHPWRWVGAAGLLGLVLWAPPVIDQVRHDPGNASLLAENLLDPPEAPIGWGEGGRLVLERLDLAQLVRATVADPGALGDRYPQGASTLRGGIVAAGLLAVAALVVRGAARDERALVALAGGTLVLAVVSVSRIFGTPWGYLLLWIWPAALLALLAGGSAVVRRRAPDRSGRTAGVVVGALAVMAVAVAGRASVTAGEAAATNPVVSRTVRALMPAVMERLTPGDRYLVTWTDAVHLGGHGYGMVDELERRGVAVAVRTDLRTQFGRHRTVAAGPVDGRLVVATGSAIEQWAAQPGAVRVTQVDVRTPEERSEARRTRTALVAALRESGLDDLVPEVDANLFAVAFDERLPERARTMVDRLDVLGAPAAVFLAPLDAELP